MKGGKVGDNGHKTNWLQLIKNHFTDVKGAGWTDENLTTIDGLIDAIKAVTDALPDAGALSDLATILTDTGTTLPATLATIVGYIDTEVATILAAVDTEVASILTIANNLPNGGALNDLASILTIVNALPNSGALSDLATILTAIEHGTYGLSALKAAIDTIAGVNTYQEQIPDTDFSLAAIDNTLTADPPNADAENSVVDIDANAGDTFVLRSLIISITSFGTGTKLTFKLWVPVNGTITEVDSVDISATGLQNLMDIFGLREIHGDSIHITVQVDSGTTGACEGTWKYAKAS